jgi:hypothetical protein
MSQTKNGVAVTDTTNNGFGDIPQMDAFGRLRVSEVTTLVDLKMLDGKRDFWINEELNGTATSVHDNASSSVDLNTSASGDYAIRQEYQRNRYQSGKSQQIFMTFSKMQPETNIVKRVGYFTSNMVAPFDSDKDGLWIESSGGDITLNIQSTGTVTSSTSQSDFNVDKLDGTGPSGITINWSKSQILFVDFEWLGVGRVRWGVVVDGLIYPMHYSNHANNGLDEVYMRSPNQPLRWEIRQTGVGSGEMKQICATVGSEGALNELGVTRSAVLSGVLTTEVAATGVTPVIGIRLKDSNLDTPPDFSGFGAFNISNNNYYQWSIWINPTITGTFTYADESDSSVQVARGNATTAAVITDGTLLIAGYSVSKSSVNNVVQVARKLGISLDGTKDQIVLGIQPVGGTGALDMFVSIDWVEIA